MILSGVAGRYARALFHLARDEAVIDRTGDELYAFQALLDDDEQKELRHMVMSPAYRATDQVRALGAVLKRMGMSVLTVNFLCLVAHNRRLSRVKDMIGAFRSLCAHYQGEVVVSVVSACSLSEKQIADFKAAVVAEIGRDVRVTPDVDPGLLGGLLVKIGSRMFDSSLKVKLNTLALSMKEVG